MSPSFEHKPGGTQIKGFNTHFSIQVSRSHGSPSGVCFYVVHDLIFFLLDLVTEMYTTTFYFTETADVTLSKLID
jgi:hypothetical protein